MDKLADGKDIEAYEKHQKEILKKVFDDVPEGEVLSKPLIYCHFAKYAFIRMPFAHVPSSTSMYMLRLL